jgi:tryptophan synthase beta chain
VKRWPDAAGRFGRFGGRFVPETLMAPLVEPDKAYARARRDRGFQSRLRGLLKDHAGRPTPLLEREDLCHVIVGSAIVRVVEERAGAPSLVTDVGDVIESLKAPLRDLGATPKPS